MIFGGLPAFQNYIRANFSRIKSLAINGASLLANGLNVASNTLFINSVMVEDPSAVVTSSTAITLTVNDHGKEYICTGATTVTVNMPASSTLFDGWKVRITRQGAGRVDCVRNGTDTIITQGTAVTTLSLPSVSDSGQLVMDKANTRFFWRGFRSFESTEIALAVSVNDLQSHNLGVIPRYYTLHARNKTAELGYGANDEFEIGMAVDGGAIQREHLLVMDNGAAQGLVLLGTLSAVSMVQTLNRTTPATVISVTTAANWKIFWRAWVVN